MINPYVPSPSVSTIEQTSLLGWVTNAQVYYKSCIDTAAIDAAGLDPLISKLASLSTLMANNPINTPNGLARILLQASKDKVSPFFQMSVDYDLKNSSTSSFYISSGGLNLPGATYYTDKYMPEYRSAVNRMLTDILPRLGLNLEPKKQFELTWKVIEFEKELAKASATP